MLAENLRAVRHQKGLTLEEIAKSVNVPNAIVLVDIAGKPCVILLLM